MVRVFADRIESATIIDMTSHSSKAKQCLANMQFSIMAD